MGTRGRKSQADFSVVSIAPRIGRPAAPDELTAEQAEEWRAVVGRLPADWFSREHHALLAEYCRHTGRARFVAKTIACLETAGLRSHEDVLAYDKLTAIAERESRAMLACARALRLTHQSRLDPKTAARRARDLMPSAYELMESANGR